MNKMSCSDHLNILFADYRNLIKEKIANFNIHNDKFNIKFGSLAYRHIYIYDGDKQYEVQRFTANKQKFIMFFNYFKNFIR